MTKRKSIIATYILAFALCLTLVLGVSLGATTLVSHAEEGKNMPQIVSVGGKMVDQINNMVNMPVGIVGEEYCAEIVTANAGDKVSIKAYDENTRGCLPKGLTFDAEKKVISGKLGLFPEDKNNDGITIYCTNEYGSTNILAWLNIYTEADKPTLASEAIPATAYVGSYYSAMVEVGGYNKSFKVSLEDNYPEGMRAYRNGVYACISFTPTSDMAGETYNFKLCVDNELGVIRKECTITVANEVVAPEFITKTQPLGYSEENPDGVRPIVGEKFEFWLQASGTNTESNPIEFFAYDENTGAKATQNSNNEYALGNGLFLTKDGKIYSNCVLEAEGQTTGTQAQIKFYIGASNKSAEGNEQGTGSVYCRLNIVKGYVIDDIIITPAKTDVPKGGTRQFEVEVKGAGELPKAVWSFYYTPDEGTTISQTGLVTVGLNESRKFITVSVTVGTRHKEASITVIDHIHATSVVEEKAKTCTNDGNIEYFKCDSCGGTFREAEAINVLTEEQVTRKAGHEYGDLTPEVPATCSATGMQAYYECGVCHKLFDESKNEKTAEQLVIAVDSSAHNYGSMTLEVAATCASEGTKAHKDCTLCHKHFDDANAEIADLTIAKNDNHDLETDWTKAVDGHYHKCKREGCKDNGKVDFAAHTKDRSEATEENAVKCTVCDYIITPALGHTHNLTLVPGTAATCQKDGKKAYYTCDGCSEKFEDEAGTKAITADIETWGIIPKAHKFGEWIAEVPATKEATGTKAHKDCEFCGKHFDNDENEITDLTIAKLPSGGDQPGGNDNHGGEVIEPKEEGLSGGAIAGIAIGAAAAAGIIVFVVLWFAVKKKSFAELIAAIKGIFKK